MNSFIPGARRPRARSLIWTIAATMLLLGGCAKQPAEQVAKQVNEEQDSFPLAPAQSPNDDRGYRFIVLDNGLRALLISDPDTQKAAAALDVYIGSSSNPADRGGLAHFLEHMLFLGTDKYPDSGEYATFIAEHGGSRNAYTAYEHTNYFFDIDDDHFPEALDRFAQFFISPRFDEEYVGREVNAVQAEYQMGLNTDARRNLDVNREVSNSEHPFSVLAVGSIDTLANRPDAPVRDDLITFYKKFYSANLMALVVLSSKSLDDLETLVTETFAPVPNHDVSVADTTVPRIEPDRLPMMVYIQPQASARSLSVSFAMPDYSGLYRAKPLQYIGNLLGHEGEGSLLSLLKQEGWAEALGAGSGIVYRGGSEFNISITLTEQGLAERDQVLRKLFEYLELLKQAGPRESLYDEQSQLSALAFRFRDETQPLRYVSGLANDMQLFAPADVLQGNFLMTDFEPELIQEILEKYFVPGNAFIQVVAQDLPVDRESQYYNTPYSVQPVDLATAGWANVNPAQLDPRLHMPAANAFIADNVEMVPLAKDNPEAPGLVSDSERLQIWQRQDDKFRVPRGVMYMNFLTAVVNDNAANAAASQLYVSLLQDSVNEFTYPAYLAGLNFSIAVNARGLGLNISGYNDKQLVLLERIVGSIANAELDNNRFDNIRKDIIRGLRNVKSARASSQVVSQTRRLLLSGRFPEEALIAELETITPEQVAKHAERLWSSASLQILLNGNYAQETADAVKSALAPLVDGQGPAAPSFTRLVRLSAGDDLMYKAKVEHDDAVMFWYLQGPDDSLESRALAALTGQAIGANYFEELRTEQQLGYIVSAFSWPQLDVPAVAMVIQSPGSPVTDLVAASRAFLISQAEPGAIDEERFERHRAALLQEITKPDKNLWEQSGRFWREIGRGNTDFDTREKVVAAIEAVSFAQWQAWYQQHVLDNPASLLIAAPGRFDQLPNVDTAITDGPEFQASRPYFQRP